MTTKPYSLHRQALLEQRLTSLPELSVLSRKHSLILIHDRTLSSQAGLRARHRCQSLNSAWIPVPTQSPFSSICQHHSYREFQMDYHAKCFSRRKKEEIYSLHLPLRKRK